MSVRKSEDPPNFERREEVGHDESPLVHARHRDEGWTMGDDPSPQECTSNFFREQDGRPPCTATAVWKVVEDYGLHMSIGFYCDADLPAEHRNRATTATVIPTVAGVVTADSTKEIARRHGHTGPTGCQDCGTTQGVHFGSWFDPKTGESGDFFQCCSCGLKAGDPPIDHAYCPTADGTLRGMEGGACEQRT